MGHRSDCESGDVGLVCEGEKRLWTVDLYSGPREFPLAHTLSGHSDFRKAMPPLL